MSNLKTVQEIYAAFGVGRDGQRVRAEPTQRLETLLGRP